MTPNAKPGSDSFSFLEAEHDVLDFWKTSDIFRKTLQQTNNSAPYIFYDGPPFATGLPHHGHLAASTIKDVVPRYFTMKGYHVQRRFGWDCHGLPIEHEIDKKLGMSSQEAVKKMGIKGYNDECRSIVQRYTSEWEKTITRIGRWVDFENDYKTMEPWYMESVWWVVKQLWEKGLIYRGVKVVPFSTALGTVLSNFEIASNYQDVQDPSVTVLFKLNDDEAAVHQEVPHLERWIAAWTTTPWTLPSNLALCVCDDIDYVTVYDKEIDKHIILAKARLDDLGKAKNLEVIEEFKGSKLVGRTYQPLFPYFAQLKKEGAFCILSDDYVTTESGTGVVHQAPAFGEDDSRVLKNANITAMVCPIDMNGRFTDEVTDFAGMHVKDADKHIIRYLKNTGNLYIQDVIEHSYPFCPRSDTPIIYRIIDSWYVKVEQMRDDLVKANQEINWVPSHIKSGRMGNWLAGAIDWAISRNRYWGTPLPIWINDVTGNQICIGSRQELAQYTGVMVEDLHREYVDPLTFALEGEEGTYRRIEEVLDCWFESGSMPYAQLHYPFENQALFDKGFPAEFIAEGLDQTRGWFYTLIVLGTALFGKHPFKNVIVNGIVMAEDGKKMSKRLRNYTPPDTLMETYGADALRLYLINSGLVRADEQRFLDSGVKDMVRRALLPWLNAFKFLTTYAQIDKWSPANKQTEPENIMDQWILSRLQSLKVNIAEEMENYRLYNVVPALFEFIEDLTNWYIRLNRSRFWVEEMTQDKASAYSTLYTTIYELSLSMAPFAPFLSETIYQELRAFGDTQLPESVHMCTYPEADNHRIKPLLERAVTRMQHIVLLGRQKRNREKVKTKFPLSRLTVVHKDTQLLDEIGRLGDYIKTELNVKTVEYSTDENKYITLYAKPNSPRLGKRFGKRFKDFKQKIETLDAQSINKFQEQGKMEIDGEQLVSEDILVFREAREGTNALSDRYVSIDLDCKLNEELIREGLAREVINRIQKSRKDAGFNVSDRIRISIKASNELLLAIRQHRSHIMNETLTLEIEESEIDELPLLFEIDEHKLGMSIERMVKTATKPDSLSG
ncbi:MAG: isoleucine--tRNA ligase [Gammaproteobacteria bacterium]|nr:isoleucine--tRNA ligase [Gammaproteobacteria bacterium]